MTRTCENCEWLHWYELQTIEGIVTGRDCECRRYPTPRKDLKHGYWCGEFKQKDKEE